MERPTTRGGFSLGGLIAIILALALLSAVLFPAVSGSVRAANMTAVASRGKGIYVAVIGANIEREPLGLPPVWPSDESEFNFTNSTDYFRYMYDEVRVGQTNWSPRLLGFDYSRLAGAGVPQWKKGPLTADCNIWTIAKNVRDGMDDFLPLLVTRNIDAASLAAKVTDATHGRRLIFDEDGEIPALGRNFVLIRGSGAIFKCREEYGTYYAVYQRQTFDTSVETNGVPVRFPLKYLMPTQEIVPGDAAYAECLGKQAGGQGMSKRVKRELRDMGKVAVPLAVLCAAVYLVVLLWHCKKRRAAQSRPVLAGRMAAAGFFHWCAVVLYSILEVGYLGRGGWPTALVLALAAQATGLTAVFVLYRNDRAAQRKGLAWMLAAPLLVAGVVVTVLSMLAAVVLVMACWVEVFK
jgi:hypothetical protein